MSNFKLNLPTDIPWERICVTEDMIDRVVCDNRLPAKWQSSLAVFKYRPENEYQLYPKYTITYLKVTATITGYQPLDKEIQGAIDWAGVNVSTIKGLTDLLNSYNPCYGAILQVVVGPQGTSKDIASDDYPFFMDFEPKKRELYEMATDTKEKQSRSLESVNVSKSSGSTKSSEVLDIDMGGGGSSAQASYAGTGGGFSTSAPNGQWGTKRVNAEEGLTSRSTDVGQEKRETFSHSTQISQMYHLLDSYHLGTNRVVFFVQPRPHTLEEPSGFVRGPRPVEGIQEFFMVVAQLKEQKDFCVSLRLDTSHLTIKPIMDYERKSESTSIASATALVAAKIDTPAGTIVGGKACDPWPLDSNCWDLRYKCFRTEVNDNVTYNAPTGFQIESYFDLINDVIHGTAEVVVTPDKATLNINVQATGHCCFSMEDLCITNCPPSTLQEWAGAARRQVQVNLVSTTKTKQTGEEQVLMITTRGLCCCASDRKHEPVDEFVVGFWPIPIELLPASAGENVAGNSFDTIPMAPAAGRVAPRELSNGLCTECQDKVKRSVTSAAESQYTIRHANELSRFIRTETLKSLNDPYVVLKKFDQTDFFAKQLEHQLQQTTYGHDILQKHAASKLPKELVARVAEHLKKDAKGISLQDVLGFRNADLSKIFGLGESEIQRLKLSALGVSFKKGSSGKKDGSSVSGAKRK